MIPQRKYFLISKEEYISSSVDRLRDAIDLVGNCEVIDMRSDIRQPRANLPGWPLRSCESSSISSTLSIPVIVCRMRDGG